jgi:peptidoglycan DL-endopeptidase CwlO
VASASPARLAIFTAAAVTFGIVAMPAAAEPKPSEAQLRTELKQLNTKVDQLIERYNLKRVELAEAKKAAEAAKKRLAGADQALAAARQRVAELAQLRYQSGALNLPAYVMPPDGGGAALLEQLTAEQQAIVDSVEAARAEQKKAADEAAKLAREISADAAEVAKQRDGAEDVIDDIGEKLEKLIPFSSGRRSDGTWAPQLPTGSDNITARTRAMKAQIEKAFKLRFTVGCFRSGSSGEHPLGRACDFMMSAGGTTPAAADSALGDQIAEWTIKNRDKLGVKYVIWKQRINHGSGWSAMSDRGSITENHYDHVHISFERGGADGTPAPERCS